MSSVEIEYSCELTSKCTCLFWTSVSGFFYDLSIQMFHICFIRCTRVVQWRLIIKQKFRCEKSLIGFGMCKTMVRIFSSISLQTDPIATTRIVVFFLPMVFGAQHRIHCVNVQSKSGETRWKQSFRTLQHIQANKTQILR